MRSMLALGGLLALLATTRPAFAQSAGGPDDVRIVSQQEVEVRSGPGDKYYPTSRLRRGEQVRVLRPSKADAKWLEIVPPPGSFSWIESRWVLKSTEDPRMGTVVVSGDATAQVFAGSALYAKDPNVITGKAVRGLFVLIQENSLHTTTDTNGPLIRIKPVPSEVRFIRADAVERPSGLQRVAAQGQTVPVGPGAATPAPPSNKVLLETQQMWRDALANPNLDPAHREQLQTLLQQSQDLLNRPGGVQGGLAVGQPGHPNNTGATPAYLVSQNSDRQHTTTGYRTDAGSAPALVPAPAPGQAQWKWSSWGMLTKSPIRKQDGQAVYVLSDSQGKVLLYAVPEAGKTLDPYTNKVIALYGLVSYRSDEFIRRDFMTVSHVAPPQNPTR